MSLVRPFLVFAAAACLLAPAAAWAEDPASDAPVATAKGSPAAPPDTTATDIKNFIAEGEGDKEPLPDHKPHGFVSVGVGSRGYREVAGAVTVPIGDKDQGQVTLAIDAGQIDGRKH
jgi:hypothetical protein